MTISDAVIRAATDKDEAELLLIDRETQTRISTPDRSSKVSFFGAGCLASDHLVAVLHEVVVGYVYLAHPTPLPSNQHVLHIAGLAVAPGHQGHGMGKSLVLAAITEARARGAAKVGLRVLGWNEPAIRVYKACGFEIEGVLKGEFLLEGCAVDDIFMARPIHQSPEPVSDSMP